MRIILLLMLLMASGRGMANVYDPLLLRAQASIFPKIILLDQNLASKSPDHEVLITIVSTKEDAAVARQLQKLIGEKYGNSLGNKNLTVNVETFEDVDKNNLATAYIVLNGSDSALKQVVARAASHGRIVFSYDYTDFGHNALISLHVKEKTYIYVNKSAVKLYGISFLPVFYKIAKIIE